MLTDTKIKSLKPKEKRYKVGDGGNLYIQIMPSGTKTFIFEFKSKETGKYKRLSLGAYPATSLLMAREKRLKFQKMLANNEEPLSHARQNITTFKSIFEKWIEYKTHQVTQKQAQIIRRYYERFFLPNFGDKDISLIKKGDIISATDALNRDGKFETLNRALNNISAFMRWAVARDYIKHNVALDIDKAALFKKPKVRHFPGLYTDSEIRVLIKKIKEYNGDMKTKIAALFALLTAQRSFTIRSARWDEINFKDKTWNIPAAKMKTRKNHIVALSTQTIKILTEYQKHNFNSEFLFPTCNKKQTFLGEYAVRLMIRKLGYANEDLTPHGFRSMFSTISYENISLHGFNERIIELCLAHTEKNQVKAAYNHALNLKERAGYQLKHKFYKNL